MLRSILTIALTLAMTACVTAPQTTPNDANLGEGNKDMALSMFDSVATTRQRAKLRDASEQTRGGEYQEPVTYQEVVEEPYEVLVPVLDENGEPVLDADGNPQTATETRYRKKILVKPVIGPDGNPLYRKATGFRNLVLNYGTVSQTATSSGESSGTQSQDNRPTSQPTNNPEINPDLNLTGP